MEYQEEFWLALDKLVAQSNIVIDRPKGSRHPKYSELIYPIDYGYLENTSSMDGGGIDIWKGTDGNAADAIICIVDLLKKDSEIKILIGCSEEEKKLVFEVHNNSEYMKGVLIRRNVTQKSIMGFDEFLRYRNIKIRNKGHERIVRMFYPYLSSVCGVPNALSKVFGKIINFDFSDTAIITGCFNGISDGVLSPFGNPDFYCKWDNGIRVYVYGALPESDMVALKENEYVLFVLSKGNENDNIAMPDNYICVDIDEAIEMLEGNE